MKASLQLSLTNQLTVTPQLQQAIRLLQLSTIDLQQEIRQQLDSNPFLETNPTETDETHTEEDLAEHEFEDVQWSTIYSRSNSQLFNENEYIFGTLHCTKESLRDHLRWQLELTPMSDVDRAIAYFIIDAINEDGFLTLTLADIQKSLNSKTHAIEQKEIEAVLHKIQRFDPIGCGAKDLAETLLIQMEPLSSSMPFSTLTNRIIKESLQLLGQHAYKELMKRYQINEQTLKQIIANVLHLNPKPGSAIANSSTDFIPPDLTVQKIHDHWAVGLNPTLLPQLNINRQYASLVRRTRNSEEHQYLKNNLQEARWFLRSLQTRQETLLKVARFIVEYQKGFLELGAEAMKPLTLNEVAQALEVHESTISRITTQKYMHTPQGLFELKYFFSSHVTTSTGEDCSSTAIRALIKKLIAGENIKKPLSDNKIAQLILEQGIEIARRTVSKYREEIGIPPSYERKRIG